jgi:hypothetical protein
VLREPLLEPVEVWSDLTLVTYTQASSAFAKAIQRLFKRLTDGIAWASVPSGSAADLLTHLAPLRTLSRFILSGTPIFLSGFPSFCSLILAPLPNDPFPAPLSLRISLWGFLPHRNILLGFLVLLAFGHGISWVFVFSPPL